MRMHWSGLLRDVYELVGIIWIFLCFLVFFSKIISGLYASIKVSKKAINFITFSR